LHSRGNTGQRLATLLENITALHVIADVMSLEQYLFEMITANFKRAITLGCDHGPNELETITFKNDNFSPLC
jgi:hypothetical protein